MPTKTWEPPPRQSDTEARPERARGAEARKFASPRNEPARNPDAPDELDRGRVDYDEINTHGSER
jgi:hypothetical protein